MDAPRSLRRSVCNQHIAGVCGGIAEYLDLDPTVVRVGYAVLSVLPGAVLGGILLYFMLWIIIPEREYY